MPAVDVSRVEHSWERPGREEAEAYGRVIARLNDRLRVIACRGDWQWIVQRRRGRRGGAPRWRSEGFYRSRKALLAALHATKEPLDPTELAHLDRLPETYREGRRV